MNHRKILMVDDDDDDQLIFREAMEEIAGDLQCAFVKNGFEALIHLEKDDSLPSIIFLDLNMPLMNGFECLERIKKEELYRKIPVVIFTTSDNSYDHKQTKDLGAELFFTKVSDFELLKLKLQTILDTDFSKPVV